MPLAVDQLELPPIGTNTYVARTRAGASAAIVVDPSGDAGTIVSHLASIGASCAAILVTHGHFDHIVSLAALAEETGAPVYAPAGERMLLEEPDAFAPPGISIRACTPDVLLEGGETIEAGGHHVRGDVECPGTRLRTSRITRTASCSPATCSSRARSGAPTFRAATGTPSSSRSLGLLDAYPSETVVCPGHGPQTTLGTELERNPFLARLRATRQEA